MASSDSENERENGFQTYAQPQPTQQPQRQQGEGHGNRWPQNAAVKMFSNELYTEGDVLGGPNNGRSLQPSMTGGHIDHNNYGNNNNTYGSNTSNNYNSNTNLNGSMSPTAPYGAQKIAQQRSTLASRRKERMEANILSPNASGETGQPSPRTERGGFGRSPSMRAAGTNLNNTNRGSDNGDSNRGDNSNGGYINSNGGYINTNNGDGDQHDQKSVLNGLAPSYDPTPKPEEPFVARPYVRPMGPPGPVPPAPIADELVISTFLNTPGPKMGPILCYILRDKGNAKMYPKFSLYLKDGGTFLLAGRKRKKATASNYVLSLDQDDLGRASDTFFGKLRANFVGTEFTIFDKGEKVGVKPAMTASGTPTNPDSETRRELGCVTYQYNVLGTRGPRKMTAIIPALDPGGQVLYQPENVDDCMLDRSKAQRGLDELVVMKNKPPRWNEELNAYCLNFNGRVTEASVKNFQLASDDNINHVILQFGKVGKDRFNMDYQWPITPLQAFAICLSSFDNKLACE